MSDILKNLCKNLNIELSYTNNKITILSCAFCNKRPSIRVHKIFKGCDDETAYAVVDYYMKAEKREDNFKIIKDYADKKFNSPKYKISPPNDKLINEFMNTIMFENPKQNEKSVLVEMNISSMTKKDFYGEECAVKLNETLKVNEDDILEVNIVLDPFNT